MDGDRYVYRERVYIPPYIPSPIHRGVYRGVLDRGVYIEEGCVYRRYRCVYRGGCV